MSRSYPKVTANPSARLFEIAIDISAPPQRVWSVTTDIERWPEWTASVLSVRRLDSGKFRVGSRARIRQPKFLPAVWEVTELKEGRNFTWVTRSTGLRAAGHLQRNAWRSRGQADRRDYRTVPDPRGKRTQETQRTSPITSPSAFDCFRRFIPRYRVLPEIRLVRHVTRERGVVAEHYIFDYRSSCTYRVEEIRKVWTIIVVIIRHSISH